MFAQSTSKQNRATTLTVNMLLCSTAAVPRSEQNTASSALVLDILHRAHHIRNAAQAGETAETESPCAKNMLVLICSYTKRGQVRAYCVVLPVSYATLVKALWPQAGQSTGAGDLFRFARGVAF